MQGVWPHKAVVVICAVMENTLETAVHYGYKYPRFKISSLVIKELKEESTSNSRYKLS